MKLKKTLLVSLLSATLIAPTVLTAVNDGQAEITVNAAKHHKKKKVAKKHKKTTKKAKHVAKQHNPQTTQQPATPSQTANPVNNDVQTYNNLVSSLGQYANPGNPTSFAIGSGTRFNIGGNQDIRNSLNDMVSNMGNTDAYDAQMYGNSAVQAFQQQALSLYQAFNDRFSSYDKTELSNSVTKIQQSWVSPSSTSPDVNNQWLNVTVFLNSLSNAFSKLGN